MSENPYTTRAGRQAWNLGFEAGRAVQDDGLPHPECVEAYHRELLLTGRTIMSVARVRQDVADAEAGRAVQDDGLLRVLAEVERKYEQAMRERGDHDLLDAIRRYRAAPPLL